LSSSSATRKTATGRHHLRLDGQVKYGDQWIRLDEYLQRRFGLSVSHGLSQEAAEKMIAKRKGFNQPGGERRRADPTPFERIGSHLI